MSPIVDAAWIASATGIAGIAGSVLVAIVSSRNSRRATETTIQSERHLRLWEKQAAAYEEVVKEMLLRRTQREYALSHGDISTGPPELEQITQEKR